MLTLEKAKKHLTIIGIRIVPRQNLPKVLQHFHLAFNRIQILSVVFLFGTYNITVFSNLIFEANGFSEVSEALTYCTIGCVHSSFYFISTWKRSKIMAFMDDLEATIVKRLFRIFSAHLFSLKSVNIQTLEINFRIGCEIPRIRTIYKRSNEMADKFSNFIWTSMFVYGAMFILPGGIVSYYNYYILEKMDQAFQLPIPSM